MDLVGRDRELVEIDRFLGDAPAGVALLFTGEAGIGKTSLWRETIERAEAAGYRVLRSRATELEAGIAFGALSDVIGASLEELVRELPAPQLRALEVALVLAEPEGRPTDNAAVAFAATNALRALARRQPILVALDDVQWLDASSGQVLHFAARRLKDADVRFVMTERTEQRPTAGGLPDAFEGAGLRRIDPGALSLGALGRVIRSELGAPMSRPLLRRLHETSRGNPFFALEIARGLQRRQPHSGFQRLPLPESLRALLGERLATLPPATRSALEIAALVADPSIALLEVAGTPDPTMTLEPAVAGGLITTDDLQIRFVHPLITSALADGLGAARRRALHERLAELVPTQEERAYQLGNAAAGPDEVTAQALERAAVRAQERGASATASELLDRAIELTPSESLEGRARRLVAASASFRDVGDWKRARELATDAVALLPPGDVRAEALLAAAAASATNPAPAEQALGEAHDPALRARISLYLCESRLLTDVRESVGLARCAAADAERAGEIDLHATALSMLGYAETMQGERSGLDHLERAQALERAGDDGSVDLGCTFNLATAHMWRDDHDAARAGFETVIHRADQRGVVFNRVHALMHLAQVEWRAGAWELAARHADEACETWLGSGDDQGLAASLWIRAVVRAHRGDLEGARIDISEARRLAPFDRLYEPRRCWVLGFAALSEGDLDTALAELRAVPTMFAELGIREPGMSLFAGDVLEALVARGELDEAETYAAQLDAAGQSPARPRATAVAARGLGLVLAARGDLRAATAELERALADHDGWAAPFERGRTMLALGELQRRGRRRTDARASLEAALALFERLIAPLWAERAQAEIGRLGGRRSSGDELTATEQRIARLVTAGLTNRETADSLVVSVHTVEAALTRIYRKLGVRSRTQLATLLTIKEQSKL